MSDHQNPASAPAAERGCGDLSRTGYSVCTLVLPEPRPELLEELLKKKVDPNLLAYRNNAVILDVSAIAYPEDLDFARLQQICRNHSLFLLGLSGVTAEARIEALNAHGVPIINSNRFSRVREENLAPRIITQSFEVRVPVEVKVPVEIRKTEPLLVVTRSVRSGETVYAPNNSVFIVGSVGDSAKIVASHHIIIIGDVHNAQLYAGSPKDQDDPGYVAGFIFVSGHFDPQLVSVAGNYQTADDMEQDLFLRANRERPEGIMVSLTGTSLHYSVPNDFKFPITAKG